MAWILVDQAGVMVHLALKEEPAYSINGKTFPAPLLESIFAHPLYPDYMVGRISELVLIETFLKGKAIDLTAEEFRQLFKSSIKPMEGMHELLARLKTSHHLAALINEGSEWGQYKLLDYAQFFEHIIISGDLKLKKPDPEFFQKSLEIIGAKPEECIFTDDVLENCMAAESLGIRSILFQDAKALEEELALLGIR